MNSKQLQYAIELSKELNFSLVAKKLRISQPALSKHISNLEKEVGVELFNRKNNPITLTAAGAHFLSEAEKLLYKEEQLYRSMEDFKKEKSGNLTIGISPFRSQYLLNDMIKKVKEKYPEIKIVLSEDSSENIKNNAMEGKYDFAIANLPVDVSLLDVIPIEQDKLVLVIPCNMSSHIKEKELSVIDFSNCKNIPFVVVSENQEMRILFEKMCYSSDIHPKISMEVVGLSTAWAMAKEGIGATLLPLQFIKSREENKEVNLYIPDCELNVRQPAIITKHGQYLPEYAKYAIEVLNKHL